MKKFFLIALFSCSLFASEIPADRLFTKAWRSAGYTGEIPSEQQAISVLDFGAKGDAIHNDSAAIQAAIDWVAQNSSISVVYFPQGTYRVEKTLRLKSGVSLRGENVGGTNLVHLKFDFHGKTGHGILIAGKGETFQSLTAAPKMRDQQIHLENVSMFQVGDYAEIRQKNDPQWDNGDSWCKYAIGQIVQITHIQGNTIQIKNPLRASYDLVYNPEIRKIQPITQVGVDNLILERIDTKNPIYGNHITFQHAAQCWVRGSQMIQCVQRFIDLHYSTNIEVSGCYFHDAYEHNGGGHAYGVECSFHTGECLIENNIFRNLRHSMIVQAGSNGNVYAYNYSTEPHRIEWPNDYASDICFHGNYPFANLFEGNVAYNAQFDNSHNRSGHLNTVFRNAVTHYGIIMTSLSHQQNIIGNDLTDNNLGHGLYIVLGQEHLEQGNRKKKIFGGLEFFPKETQGLKTKSLYLDAAPTFWNINHSWPSIGDGSTENFGSKIVPAKIRFASTSKTIGPVDSVYLTVK